MVKRIQSGVQLFAAKKVREYIPDRLREIPSFRQAPDLLYSIYCCMGISRIPPLPLKGISLKEYKDGIQWVL